METDGRIRSKDIESGGVNSRILNDIRSDDFNGSRTNPEGDPGTVGWQILKNGFVVFNNAIIRGELRAGRIISGTLNVGSGGSITIGGDEETGVPPVATMDEDGFQVTGSDAEIRVDSTEGSVVLKRWVLADEYGALEFQFDDADVDPTIVSQSNATVTNMRLGSGFPVGATTEATIHLSSDDAGERQITLAATELFIGISSSATIGFFGAAGVSKPTVTGSRGGNAALASLLTALANLGLITDSTSA
jgi:hypothetical protein